MPVIKKVGSKSPAVTTRAPSVLLPSAPNVPPTKFSDYSILLYGRKKIGKTSLAASLEDSYIIATEPGTKALRVRSTGVTTYKQIDELLKQLEEKAKSGKPYCKTLVFDTIDLVYELAWDHVCKTKMINHPREEKDFGATWKEIKDLFRAVVTRSLNLGCGVVFISHSTEKEVEMADGSTIERIMPTMASRAFQEVEGIVDVIAFYDYIGRRRCLTLAGSDTLVAGVRCKEHYRTTTGERIESIDMGADEDEAAKNFQLAFSNKLTKTRVEPDAKPASRIIKK